MVMVVVLVVVINIWLDVPSVYLYVTSSDLQVTERKKKRRLQLIKPMQFKSLHSLSNRNTNSASTIIPPPSRKHSQNLCAKSKPLLTRGQQEFG